MSQRTALLVSLALTALVGAAIVANRDRLMGASPEPPPAASSAVTIRDLNNAETSPSDQNSGRVIEVTLPTNVATLSRTSSTDGNDDRFDDDRFEDEDHDDDHDDDHFDDDDENDDYEDDEDDDDD